MNPKFPIPHDDYALSILTQAAAMSQNTGSNRPDQPHQTSFSLQRADMTSTTSTTNHSINNLHSQSPVLNGFASSSRSMETLSFNQGQMRQHPYMSSEFPDVNNHLPRNYSNNLGILNAENFDDSFGRSGENKRNVPNGQILPFGLDHSPELRLDHEQPKTTSDDNEKRPKRLRQHKIEPDPVDEDEEARKKARGRPRVDPKDETAADRRRTQIRMAQRAYRNRKETTITTLEKQVQELRGTNEEMSNIFTSLYDFAVGQGLLQREPEFGQQLQSTTERFLALAKSTSQEDGSQDEQNEEVARSVEIEARPRTRVTRTAMKKLLQQNPIVSEAPAQPWGGYVGRLSPSDSPVEEISPELQMQIEHRPRQNEMQIVTQPTEENASFPFEFMNMQQYHVDVPPMEDYSQTFFQPLLQPSLPATHSYAEFSLARRIQRLSVERAYRLITMPNPPEKRFREVFGLTLSYKSKEEVLARMKRQLVATDKESLMRWNYPFAHIGGAGTYYPNYDSAIETDLMPKFRTGYSMGPFNPLVGQAQELMDDDLKCNLAGFEGEFFDANDVEGYLRGRGLEISASADYVTAELDTSILTEAMTPRSDSVDTLPTLPSPKTPKTPASPVVLMHQNDVAQNLIYDKSSLATFPFPITLWPDGSSKTAGPIDPIFNTISDNSPKAEIRKRSFPNKRLVTINVEVLLDGLLSKAVCLGRAAGFRLADVNAAIVAAVKAGY